MYSMPTFDTLSLSYTLGIKYTCTLGEDNMQKQWTGVTVTCVYINYVYIMLGCSCPEIELSDTQKSWILIDDLELFQPSIVDLT